MFDLEACMHVYLCACVRVCVRVRESASACVRVCGCMCACAHHVYFKGWMQRVSLFPLCLKAIWSVLSFSVLYSMLGWL